MTSRERVLETFRFRKTDRSPYDLTDGRIWPELLEYFASEHGLPDRDSILDFLGTDFRWIEVSRRRDDREVERVEARGAATETVDCSVGPLGGARSVEEVERGYKPGLAPADLEPIDFPALRARWPEHAIVLLPYATPYFWSSCDQFGMQEAFIKMVDAPEVYRALLDRLAADSLRLLTHLLAQARGYVDVVELWDDMAGQGGMLVDPSWWRAVIRPYLAREVELVRDHGMKLLFHSCGSVRPILSDLVEIGVNALEVFQVNAAGMEPRSIARDFGGKLAFYGGIDVQKLLSFGTPEEVAAQVRHNIDCFRECGGYMVANCHSHIRSIQGRNIVAMCEAARGYRL